jgi:hypothetical protein
MQPAADNVKAEGGPGGLGAAVDPQQGLAGAEFTAPVQLLQLESNEIARVHGVWPRPYS